MADWDGRGLPPAAAERMQRFRDGGVQTSLLGVAGMVSVTNAGLPPVGEVMGCMVEHIGWQGWGGCGYGGGGYLGGWSMGGSPSQTVTSSRGSAWAGYKPYVDALYRGYRSALHRMVTEAGAMGADGVVGVRLSAKHLGEGNREFVALGTAVRSAGPGHPPNPFVTDLAGTDVGKLLQAGWVPVSIAIGISVAVRHDDWATRSQARSWNANAEVTGYTDLVQHVRADARTRFAEHVARAGADGAIVSRMGLHVWEIKPSEQHRDHVAESSVFGTAIAKFHRGESAPTDALTILPLRRI